MPYRRVSLLVVFLIGVCLTVTSHGAGASQASWSMKSEKKTAVRWTLQEWLLQKERNQWMDQWLMLHTPTPYEFALEVSSVNYTLTSTTPKSQYKTIEGSLTAYATLVGLEVQTNNNFSEGFIDDRGLFHLRLLGSSDQGTHLTLSLGQQSRKYTSNNNLQRRQNFSQADLTLYLNNHFGIQGIYRMYQDLKNDSTFGDLSGTWQHYNVFIDFEALRIFGGLYRENETQTLNNSTTQRTIEGTHGGLRFYF